MWHDAYGGSSLIYNNNWIDETYTFLPAGQTLSGFDVVSMDATAPTAVNWFAYANLGVYTGTGYFNTATNPGFEGVASGSSSTSTGTPEPGACALFGSIGLAAASFLRRRRAR